MTAKALLWNLWLERELKNKLAFRTGSEVYGIDVKRRILLDTK